jgi:DNA-binding MarR family transcriptional regulator
MAVRVDPRRLAVWHDFLRAHAALVDVLGRELEAERRLPLHWYDVLVTLAEAPAASLRMSHLAEAVAFSRSGLTRLVDRMERAGLVRRRASGNDRRVTFAELTSEGRAVLRRAAPTHLRGIALHFAAAVSDDEVEVLEAVLRRILDHLAPGAGGPAA